MSKMFLFLVIPVLVFGFDIQKIIDKNATETQSYKAFIKKHGTAKYHLCKNGILFQVAHNPYESASKETMVRNLLLNPIKCEPK